ncbi:MAG TPA: helix-turn-helix domain-containing protein [Syntrophorhabdales bacterium]|nr:helix-turn-helix domain-containing protein [Syntrophorhabdales bacterium]
MVYISELPGRTLLKPSEVASLFGVSPQTVYNWHRMGMIHGVKISGILRIYASSLGEMIQ